MARLTKRPRTGVFRFADFTLGGVESELAGNGPVQPAVWSPGMRGGKRAAEVAVLHRLCKSEKQRHELRRTPRHRAVHGHVADGHIALGGRNRARGTGAADVTSGGRDAWRLP